MEQGEPKRQIDLRLLHGSRAAALANLAFLLLFFLLCCLVCLLLLPLDHAVGHGLSPRLLAVVAVLAVLQLRAPLALFSNVPNHLIRFGERSEGKLGGDHKHKNRSLFWPQPATCGVNEQRRSHIG